MKDVKVYGYARISTKKQSLSRQIENIKKYNDNAIIFQEAFTGTKISRPEFDKLLKVVKKGDTIIFDSVSRMSRCAEDGITQYFELYNKGINLVFLKERHIDTDSYKNAIEKSKISIDIADDGKAENVLIKGIMDAINIFMLEKVKDDIVKAFEQSEKEVMDLQQRTKEGMATKGAGVKISEAKKGKTLTTKKSVEMKEKIKKLSQDFDGNMKDIEVMELLKIARNTYYKYKREINESEEI